MTERFRGFRGLSLMILYLSQEFQKTFIGYLAQLFKEPTIIPEIDVQHYRQAEDVLTVRQRIGYGISNECYCRSWYQLL